MKDFSRCDRCISSGNFCTICRFHECQRQFAQLSELIVGLPLEANEVAFAVSTLQTMRKNLECALTNQDNWIDHLVGRFQSLDAPPLPDDIESEIVRRLS